MGESPRLVRVDAKNLAAEAAKGIGLPARLTRIESRKEALGLRASPGVFQMYLDGAFLGHELMTGGKFSALLEKRRGGEA